MLLRYLYRHKLANPPDKQRKLREIALWKMTANRINAYEGEEAKVVKKKLEEHIKNLVRDPFFVSQCICLHSSSLLLSCDVQTVIANRNPSYVIANTSMLTSYRMRSILLTLRRNMSSRTSPFFTRVESY